MTAPIPRPPGPWRALARDNILNPEEAATREATLVALRNVREIGPEASPAADSPEPTPEARLIRFQSAIDRAGWRISYKGGDERARVEGFHPDGHAVMATAIRGRPVRTYVLVAAGKRTPRWAATSAAALEHFLVHRQLPAGAVRRRPNSKCQCKKAGRYPTETLAKLALLNILINKEIRQGRQATERRAYRCPDDDRVWHLTSRASGSLARRSPAKQRAQ